MCILSRQLLNEWLESQRWYFDINVGQTQVWLNYFILICKHTQETNNAQIIAFPRNNVQFIEILSFPIVCVYVCTMHVYN